MKRKQISIITICYNESKLKRTCESIVNQTFQDFEWIVIDAGSNKEILSIFDKYKKRIDYFVSEPDKGRYNGMNKGIKAARGEYLNFMNAGDVFVDENVLNKVSKYFESQAEVYYGNGYFETLNNIEKREYCNQPNSVLVYNYPLFHQAMFFKRELFEKYGMYDESFKIVADWKYYIQLLKNNCKFEYLDLFIAKDDICGISNSNKELCENERKAVLKSVFTSDEQKLIIKEQKKLYSTSLIQEIRKKNAKVLIMPKVSVIIPVYNAKDYLERCLNSVCNQTLKGIEIICVDDCSTDNSLEILNEYAKKYSQMKVIHHKINGGESKARNTGLDNATGEYIGFVDNDDAIDLDFYEKLYNKAKEENADIAKGEVRQFCNTGKEEFPQFKINEHIKETNNKMYFLIHWWTAIYKRELITTNDIHLPENVILGGDAIFLNRVVMLANKVALVDDVFYYYYRRENSGDSDKLSIEKVESLLNTVEFILDNITKSENLAIDKDVYNYIFRFYGSFFYDIITRNHSIECATLCSEYAIRNYRNCKYQEDYKNFLLSKYPYLTSEILDSENKKALISLFQKYDTLKKILISRIMYIRRKNSQYEK